MIVISSYAIYRRRLKEKEIYTDHKIPNITYHISRELYDTFDNYIEKNFSLLLLQKNNT